MLLNKLAIYSQVHIRPDMYRRIMNFYCLMHIIVCHKKLTCTYINAITRSSQRKQRSFLGHLVLRIFKLLLAIMRHYVLQFLINRGVLKLLFLMQC